MCRDLCKYLNIVFEEDVFDEAAYNTCFRMYKVLKYDRKIKKYMDNSNYEFFKETELTPLQKFQTLCIQTELENSNVKLSEEIVNKLNETKKNY